MFNPINHPATRELRMALGLSDEDETSWLALLLRVQRIASAGMGAGPRTEIGLALTRLNRALGLSEHLDWDEALNAVRGLVRDRHADPTFTRDEATAQVRRALAIGGRVTWDEVIAELYRRTAVNRKGWVSGWGTVMQQGHATFYGEVRTELCGGVPMVYLLLPEIEATDDREGLPEQEVFFPLATLYRFTPTAEHEVIDARRAQAPLKMEAPPAKPKPPPSQEALVLFASLAKWGRTWYDAAALDKLTPEQRAVIKAWAEAGCPDPAPAVYDEDVPF